MGKNQRPSSIHVANDGDLQAVAAEIASSTMDELMERYRTSVVTVWNWESKYNAKVIRICRICNERKPATEMLVTPAGRTSQVCLKCDCPKLQRRREKARAYKSKDGGVGSRTTVATPETPEALIRSVRLRMSKATGYWNQYAQLERIGFEAEQGST